MNAENKSEPVRRLGGFKLIKKLGQGAMGAVFLANQESMDREVALKVLPPAIAKNSEFIERFKREAKASAKLIHPNIIQGIDVGQDKATGLWYFAMDYVDGITVKELLKKEGAIPEKRALKIARDIASALECAEKHHVVHRDIKPDNIMLDSRDRAMLADLGLAKNIKDDASMTQTGTAIGTPHYMSPEQARGSLDEIDIRTDIYALGTTLFHLVTGQTPFDGPTSAVIMTKHLTDPVPRADKVNPKVSKACGRLIARMMQKSLDRRTGSPAVVIQEIDDIHDFDTAATTGPRAPIHRGTTGPMDAVSKRRKRQSGQQVPVRGATTGPHDPIPDRKGRGTNASKSGLAIAIGAAALLLLAVVLFALPKDSSKKVVRNSPSRNTRNRPSKPGKRPLPSPSKSPAHGFFEAAAAYEREHPGEFEEIIKRYTKAVQGTSATVSSDSLNQRVTAAMDATRKRQKQAIAADAAWETIKRSSTEAAGTGDYDDALATLKNIPSEFAASLNDRANLQANVLGQEVETKINSALKAAGQLSKYSKPKEGLERLLGVEKLKFAPMAEAIQTLKTQLTKESALLAELIRKKALAEAEKHFAAYLKTFDDAILKSDWRAAKAIAKKGKTQTSLAPFQENVEALNALAEAHEETARLEREALNSLKGRPLDLTIGTKQIQGPVARVDTDKRIIYITHKIAGGSMDRPVKLSELSTEQRAKVFSSKSKKTQSPAHQLASALISLGGWQQKSEAERIAALEKAARALAPVHDHILAPHYKHMLEVLKLGELEVAAKQAWQSKFTPLLALKKMDETHAEKAKHALEAFLKNHGKTEFTRSEETQKLVARLREKMEEALGGVILANVRKVFRGKVEHFNPTTYEIKLVYTFDDPAQAKDFSRARWSHKEVNFKVINGQLNIARNEHGELCHMGRFGNVSARIDFSALADHRDVALTICSDGNRNKYQLFGMYGHKITFMSASFSYDKRKKLEYLSKKVRSPLTASKGGRLSLSYKDGSLEGMVGDLKFSAKDDSHPTGRVGLYTNFTEINVDALMISGVLQREWIEAMVASVAPRKRNANKTAKGYRCIWRKMNPSGLTIEGKPGPLPDPKFRFSQFGPGPGVTYDSKRKLGILYGGVTYTKPAINDLWSYDPVKDIWACLVANNPHAKGVRQPLGATEGGGGAYPQSLAYHRESDTYWMAGFGPNRTERNYWTFHPEKREFSKTKVTFPGTECLGYNSTLKCLVTLNSLIDPRKETKQRFDTPPPDLIFSRRGSRAPSCRSSGGFTRSDVRGQFLIFGGGYPKQPQNPTWILDPVRGQWTELKPKVSPSNRPWSNLVYNSALDIWVLFGGLYKTDTWIYASHLNSWLDVTPKEDSPRNLTKCTNAMWYDEARDLIVLYTARGETWTGKIIPK